MARRFTRGRRFGRRPRIPTKWTGNGTAAEGTVTAGNSTSIVIVGATDYEGGTVSGAVEAGGATLLRIRGSIDMRATVVGGLAFMYIAVLGSAETVHAATNVLAITSGDTLWQDVRMVSTAEPVHIEIDVRSKRRLENDQVVFVVSSIAQSTTFSAQFRALIKSSG